MPDAAPDATAIYQKGTVFHGLAPSIQALLRDEGWAGPTKAQEAALPSILAGKHTLLIAPTGMGKTEAAILPIFHELLAWRASGEAPVMGFHVLYVTPLRALNRDLLKRLEDWGERLGIRVAVRHGDTTQSERTRQSKNPPDVLITTPETFQLLFTGHRLRSHLEGVRWVVIDEVHELAADERGAQLALAMERLVALAGEPQRVGLSATVGDADAVARYLGGRDRPVAIEHVPVAKELDIRVESPVPDLAATRLADRLACRADAAAHLRRAMDLIRDHESTLLFVNTRESAEVLSARMKLADPDFPIAVHHGSLSREVRVQAEEEFKEARVKGLICTSSMELGIDIGQADLVIQYTSPRQVTRLVQRVGRAGHRADALSNGVILATDPDDVLEALVVARRTLAEELEVHPGPTEPLDVLANQLAAMTLERGRAEQEDFYELAIRSAPFQDLRREDLDEVLQLLADRWIVWREDGGFGSKRRGYRYFFDNVSMIPDERTYRIVNMATGTDVARLDESFVRSFIEPGASFICQGRAWRVAELDDEIVRVTPVADPLGAVPSWIGEEIPVPYAVAQEVGRLRQAVQDLLTEGDRDHAVTALMDRYPAGPEAAGKAVDHVGEQLGYKLPTDTVLTLEFGDGQCILNACLGHRVNETLGRLVASLLTARLGTSVGLRVDPYRIMWTLPRRAGPELVMETLTGTPPEGLAGILSIVLQNSHDLRHRLVHVAKKFGVLEKDADWRRVNVGRLLEVYRDTAIFREALRQLLHDRLDVPKAAEVLGRVQDGSLEVVVQGLSPLGLAGLDDRVELVSPARAHRTLLEAVRRRLESAKILLLCLNCREWRAETTVARAESRLTCPRCGSIQIAVTRPWNEMGMRTWRKAPEARSADEKKEWRRLHTTANLVMSHKHRAILALAARGVGPDTAGRILHKQREDEEGFLRDVLEAEVTYARTRQFWD